MSRCSAASSRCFAVAGAFAGFAGALGAFFTPYVSQDTYPPFVSFGYVVMAVVGGLGSVWGGVVGTLALSLWLQVLSTLSATPGMPAAAGPILQYAGYGVVLVLFLLFVPRGIVPTVAGRWAALRGQRSRARERGRTVPEAGIRPAESRVDPRDDRERATTSR